MRNEKVYKALGIFLDTMRPYVVRILEKYFPGQDWQAVFYAKLTPDKQMSWNNNAEEFVDNGTPFVNLIDFSNLPTFAFGFKEQLSKEFNDKKSANRFINWIQELQDTRNKCQHYNDIDADEEERSFSNMKMVAKLIGDNELYDEIIKISSDQQVAPSVAEPKPAGFVASSGKLIPWFQNVVPHYDIRNSQLDESIFAANLWEVALGTAPEVYLNSSAFFEKTFVTQGIRDIASRVVAALNGTETQNRVISLKTGFGGGKTHSLITLYHIVKCGAHFSEMGVASELLKDGLTPTFDNARVAVFTHDTNDVIQGRQVDGITIRTLWGEIAYQLDGMEGYEKLRANDEAMIAPTAQIFKSIIEPATPSLILIDELASYCNRAKGKNVGKTTLYDESLTFVQTLTEVVSSVPKCALIVTLPDSATEVGSTALGQEILSALQHRVVRVGSDITPVDNDEIYEVVRRRLFESINDEEVVKQVATQYKNMYHNRRNDLPDECTKIEYVNRMIKAYPFHPELIDMFRLRWGNDHRFQRTRGVLRQLASIVQDLWKRRMTLAGTQALIHTSDVNLENLGNLTGTVTSLMGANWDTVMHADVYGSVSNAFKIDSNEFSSNIGQFYLTQGIASTLLLASIGDPSKNGLSMKELKKCMLKPNAFNHNDIDGALNKFEQVAQYLHASTIGEKRYWFQSKPNINIILNQAKDDVKDDEINAEIIKRMRNSHTFVTGLNVLVAPSSDIPEQKQLTAIILSPEYVANINTVSHKTESFIQEVSQYKGTSPRFYRNTMFYIVCSEAGKAVLDNKIRYYLACQKVQETYTSLEREQKDDVQKRKTDADKESQEAIAMAYSVVLKYSAKEGLARYDVKEFTTDFSTQLMSNIVTEMKNEDWLLDSIGKIVLSRNNLLPTLEKPIKVKDLYEAFLRYDDKPMISSSEAIITTVNRYCSEGVFNVASGEEGNYDKVYHNEKVPFLNVTDEDYWLVDKSVEIKKQDDHPQPGSGNDEGGTGVVVTGGNDTPKGEEPKNDDEPKEFKRIKISGSIGKDQWTQLWTSFLVPLRDNGLHISVEFDAQTTAGNPLTENSYTVRCVKESAAQLGMKFETGE